MLKNIANWFRHRPKTAGEELQDIKLAMVALNARLEAVYAASQQPVRSKVYYAGASLRESIHRIEEALNKLNS